MELTISYNLFRKQYGYRIVRTLIALAFLTIGGLIYIGCRDKSLLMFSWFNSLGFDGLVDSFRNLIDSEGIYGWVKNSLPDGLWLFSYMFLVDTIWNGAGKKVSYIFIYSLPFFAILSELLQYLGLCPGVFDWMDIASYAFAIVLFLGIKMFK